MMTKFKVHGLVADLMPNITLMKAFAFFLFNYNADNSSMKVLLRKIYAIFHTVLILVQFFGIVTNMALQTEDVNELTANTITVFFFAHSIVKFAFFAITSKNFYRTLGIWNQSNSHPLFAESNARYHSLAVTKMRRLLYAVAFGSLLTAICFYIQGEILSLGLIGHLSTIRKNARSPGPELHATGLVSIAWTTITFFGESVRFAKDHETNETITEEVPRLPVKSYYPFDAMSGMPYMICFGYQLYWLIFSLMQANLLDVMFCSWLIFACEQLQHLKSIMKPLMELSASLDTYRPNTSDLFRSPSAGSQKQLIADDNIKSQESLDVDLRGIYSNRQDFGMNFRTGSTLQQFGTNGTNPNGLTKKQEMLVRSAIKYWVERHKHVVRLVAGIGDTYGTALLFHMLISTITLTLLAYQATKISGVDVYSLSVIGYLVYTLAQVFLFCIFGNRLIEESSSVMEAAYSCHWYDGSEEAKTFVQIVCQQCQKAMSISGAKFFTVSLDLFASVLGAVVTYFMVLVQLS